MKVILFSAMLHETSLLHFPPIPLLQMQVKVFCQALELVELRRPEDC